MEATQVIGEWDAGFREFSVVETADGLKVRFPEAPEGFEATLVESSPHHYRLEGGPLPDAEIWIEPEQRASLGGVVPLTRLDHPAQSQPGSGLVAPPLDLDDAEEEAFIEAWARVDHPSHVTPGELGGFVVHRFVQWLMDRNLVIFHGSNDLELEVLTPVRRSMEALNTGSRGNLAAVYGTHDGLWSMFFAIVDRKRLRGTIRNGVDRHHSPTGRYLDLYHFSVDQGVLEQRPFTTGALYLLPRADFECLPLYPGGPPSPEWACKNEVTPLARLTVSPGDFPFLDQIGGHDDGALIELEAVADEVYDGVVSARRIEGGVEIVTNAERATVDRLVELSRQFFPDVARRVTDDAWGIKVAMTGPDAFQQGMQRRFSELLEKH